MDIKFTETVKKIIPEVVESDSKKGWVNYGTDNLFPNYLWSLYLKSSVMTSIVNTMVDYTMGDEIINHTAFLGAVNRKGDTLEAVVKKCVTDYCIFGGFAFQIIRNKLHEVAEINWLDFQKVRVNEDEDKIYYKDWDKRPKQVVYDKYVRGGKQPNSIFYFKGNITRGVYPIPMYIGALKSIEISAEISNYHLNNILNNFNVGTVINFNSGQNLTEDEMQEIEDKVYERFSGSNNSGKILLSFNNDKEHATEFSRMPDDGYDKKYESLYESTMKDIYSAFRCNPVLCGYNNVNSGFSGQEFSEAHKLYSKTVIEGIQKDIIRAFEQVFGEGCIEIKPFTIHFDETMDENNNDTDIVS